MEIGGHDKQRSQISGVISPQPRALWLSVGLVRQEGGESEEEGVRVSAGFERLGNTAGVPI